MSSQIYPRNVIENVIKNFDLLISSTSVQAVLDHSHQIGRLLHYDENDFGLNNFFKLRNALNIKSLSKWNRVASILKALDQKSNQKEYFSRCKVQGKKILVIGGGISGLRASIELLLLGAQGISRKDYSK
ncbi:jagged-1b protein [Sarcoptes scabiei]|nr:jagged-1b protein [Sarcoptes scabiei]